MKTLLTPLMIASVGALTVSCVYDDPNYDPAVCGVTLEVVSSDGNNSQLSETAVYIYNSAGSLVGYHASAPGSVINLEPYREQGTLHVVAWGNAQGSSPTTSLSPPMLGSSITSHSLAQLPSGAVFGGMTLSKAPGDLFFGTMEIDFASTKAHNSEHSGEAYQLPISRQVSSYALTVANLGRAFGGVGSDYRVVVRHPHSGLDFGGVAIGGESVFLPEVQYDAATDRLTTSINMALPTGGDGLRIEIYVGGELVYAVGGSGGTGEVLTLESNQLKNILIDMSRDGDVTVVGSDWGEAYIFQLF